MSNYQSLLDSAEKDILKLLWTHVELASVWLWECLKPINYKTSNTILTKYYTNS